MNKTEGLTSKTYVNVEGVDGATTDETIHAFLTDLMRRHKAGEILTFKAEAKDYRGNTLTYETHPYILGKAIPPIQ